MASNQTFVETKPTESDFAWAFASNCFLSVSLIVYLCFCEVRWPVHAVAAICLGIFFVNCMGCVALVLWKSKQEHFQGLYVSDAAQWFGKVMAGLAGMIVDSSFPDTSVPAIVVSFLLWLAILCGKQLMQPRKGLGFLDMAVTMVAAKSYEALSGALGAIAAIFLCCFMVAVEVILQRKYWANPN